MVAAGEGHPEELTARGVTVRFEGLTALDNVDLALRSREILGLIGPNGAGKTTLVNVISGFQPPDDGRIAAGGQDLTGWSPHRFGRAGLARTFQAVRLFSGLSVLENVELGAIGCGRSRRQARETAYEIIAWLGMAEQAWQQADTMPYGDERRVGIARALAMAPRFLLLDEPAAGLDEAEADELMGTISQIRTKYGCGVLVIEHNMRLIMGLCDRIQVLDQGRTIAVGTPPEVQADAAVRRAYLGGQA